MTTAPALVVTRVDLVEAFRAQCEARVYLVDQLEMDLHEAVDGLQAAAVATGLVDQVGVDGVQAIMSDAFVEGIADESPMSWDSAGWKDAAREYHEARGDRPAVIEIDADRLNRLRRLLDNNVSIDRAWAELNVTKGRAADWTVEALMFSLRERGAPALDEPNTRRRLAELSDEQAIEVGTRLQRLKPKIARPWTADEVETLVRLRETLR
jgi:hypothetical protein